jgi:hypothetical protein
MNKLDLIIEAIEFSKLVDNQVHRNELIEDALEDLRELRELKPVAWIYDWYGFNGGTFADKNKVLVKDWIASIYSEVSDPTIGAHNIRPLYASTFVSTDNSAKTVDHGFDRTASHMAGEYVDTKPQNLNTSAERVQKSDKSIHERKYPDHETYCGRCGACTYKPWVGLTDDKVKDILDCGRGGAIDIKKAETKLRDKNG